MAEEGEEAGEAAARMSNEEVNALVAEVVRHMLFRNFQQPGVPVRREELNQIVTRSYKQQRGLSGLVIDKARRKITSVFGMEMHELHKLPRQHNARGGGSGSQGGASGEAAREYFLRSTVPVGPRQEFVDAPETVALRGLALAIVSIIHLSPGRSCKQEDLWLQLGKLGIEEADERHPVFGSIKNTMELLQRQRFFHKERSEEDGFVYTLAERALEANAVKKLSNWIPKFMEWDMFAHESDSDDSDDKAAAATQGAANGDGDHGDEGDDGDDDGDGRGGEERESLE